MYFVLPALPGSCRVLTTGRGERSADGTQCWEREWRSGQNADGSGESCYFGKESWGRVLEGYDWLEGGIKMMHVRQSVDAKASSVCGVGGTLRPPAALFPPVANYNK